MGQTCCKKVPDMSINLKDVCQDVSCRSRCLSTCCITNPEKNKKHHTHHHHSHSHHHREPTPPATEIKKTDEIEIYG
jgi:hypothetical protein